MDPAHDLQLRTQADHEHGVADRVGHVRVDLAVADHVGRPDARVDPLAVRHELALARQQPDLRAAVLEDARG